jgi:hypothetical protein
MLSCRSKLIKDVRKLLLGIFLPLEFVEKFRVTRKNFIGVL